MRAGVCTLLDWCDFLNEQRFDAIHAGPLAWPELELNQWAKRTSKGMTKTNLIKTHYKRPKVPESLPPKSAAWTLGVKRGKSGSIQPREKGRPVRVGMRPLYSVVGSGKPRWARFK